MAEDVASSSPCALLSVFLYGASCIALTAFSIMGIPYTEQGLGALIFLSAFPLLWLVERRAARMTQLILEALRHASTISDDGVDPRREGQLLMVTGHLDTTKVPAPSSTVPLAAPAPSGTVLPGERDQDASALKAGAGAHGAKSPEALQLQRWGVEGPQGSVAVRAHIESWSRLKTCSCEAGWWCEGGAQVPSLEERAPTVLLGAHELRDLRFLDSRDAWAPFSPARGERFELVLAGAEDKWVEELEEHGSRQALSWCPCCAAPMGAIARRWLANPLPFPGERPIVEHDDSVLYYPRGGGNPRRPQYGDIRVSFLHVPGGDELHPFTVLGVQRGKGLEPFRFRQPPPRGIDFGPAAPADFNLGPDREDESRMLLDVERAKWQPGGESSGWNQKPPPLPASLWMLSAVLSTALDGWRVILHKTAPETMLFCVPGSHGRCSFFMKADGSDLFTTWKLRILGFLVMVAGVEVAFWKWEVFFELIPYLGAVFSNALWLVAVVGAAGFTATTIALASIYYRPISALLYLTTAATLFAALLGKVLMLTALSIVGVCMAALLSLFACHLILPC